MDVIDSHAGGGMLFYFLKTNAIHGQGRHIFGE